MSREGQPQDATPRMSEGSRLGSKAPASKAKRGRPLGAKNKPKSLVPADVANSLLLVLQDTLPTEQYEYLRGVVRGGQAVSTKHELDILLTVLNRNLLPHLVGEMGGMCDEDCGDVCYRHAAKINKDVTERVRAVKDLLALRNQIERREEDPNDGQEPVLTIYAKRGFDPARLAKLVGTSQPERVQPQLGTGEVLEGRVVPGGEEG